MHTLEYRQRVWRVSVYLVLNSTIPHESPTQTVIIVVAYILPTLIGHAVAYAACWMHVSRAATVKE